MAAGNNDSLRFFTLLVSIFALLLLVIFAVRYAHLFVPDAPGLIIGFLFLAGSSAVGFCATLLTLRRLLKSAGSAEVGADKDIIERLALFMTLWASFSFISMTTVCLLGGFNMARLH